MISFSDSDLATERCRDISDSLVGIKKEETDDNGVRTCTLRILTEDAAAKVGKDVGTYVTVEYDRTFQSAAAYHTAVRCLSKALRSLLPCNGQAYFCVGLGNPHLTADAYGPSVIDRLVVTRHIKQCDEALFRSLGLSDVSALSPGVLGQTGLESADIVSAAVRKIKPDAVILLDALAALDKERLCATVQISDTGITPGSGIGNKRLALDSRTLGVPVVSVGVPTVIRASALCESVQKKSDLIVTPKDIDILICRAARLTAEALNRVFHPALSEEELELLKG